MFLNIEYMYITLYLYICTCECVYLWMYVCVFMCIYTCVVVHRYIHVCPRCIPENTTNKLEREYQYTRVQTGT